MHNYETSTYEGYSLATGEKLWGPVGPNTNSWSYYVAASMSAYGDLYTCDFGGVVNAYDITTGEHKWTWNTESSGLETPYSIYPLLHIDVIADGKLYIMGGHTYSPPLFHNSKLYCLNATTGEEIWSTFNFPTTNGASAAIADGYLIEPNAYDNQIYCYSRGPSATMVSIQDDVIVNGESVLVKGMVTDISPGTEDYAQTARFPEGVPAIADENMSAWMEYVYMQQPKPTDASGVDVTVSVLDPNGNSYDVATATSDVNGFYSATFTPPVPGKYTVYATFAGSESYWPSSAVTALNVEEAPEATPAPTPVPASAADLYFLPMSIGTIVAIIVIGLLLFLMIRKR